MAEDKRILISAQMLIFGSFSCSTILLKPWFGFPPSFMKHSDSNVGRNSRRGIDFVNRAKRGNSRHGMHPGWLDFQPLRFQSLCIRRSWSVVSTANCRETAARDGIGSVRL